MDDEIEAVGTLLHGLAAKDVGFRVFGASTHGYRLGPTLTEHDLRLFETEQQVRLPPDYRAFLNWIGNGGAGPHYGLSPLSSSLDGFEPSEPFPWKKAVFIENPDWVGLTHDDVEPGDFRGVEPLSVVPGAIHLAEEGCAYYSFLVVNGPAYGTVWNNWMPADCGLIPTGQTFLAWYRQWVERCLNRLAREPLVDRVVPGMERAAVVALLGDNYVEDALMHPQHDGGETVLGYRDVAVSVSLTNGVVTRVARLPI